MNELVAALEEAARLYWRRYLALAKFRGAVYYMEGVQSVRRLFIFACLLGVCVRLFVLGLILIPVALCLYMPWTPEVKAGVAILSGLVYLAGSLAILSLLLSERQWLKVSRAREFFEKAAKEI